MTSLIDACKVKVKNEVNNAIYYPLLALIVTFLMHYVKTLSF